MNCPGSCGTRWPIALVPAASLQEAVEDQIEVDFAGDRHVEGLGHSALSGSHLIAQGLRSAGGIGGV